MSAVTIDEAKARLSALIEEAVRGVEVVILKGDEPAVRLVPVMPPAARPQFGSAKGLIVMSDDFDAPLEEFKDYTP